MTTQCPHQNQRHRLPPNQLPVKRPHNHAPSQKPSPLGRRAASQPKQAAKASSQAAAQSQQTQTSTATTSRQNNFSGDTDTAQTDVSGNRNSKIYHVETGKTTGWPVKAVYLRKTRGPLVS